MSLGVILSLYSSRKMVVLVILQAPGLSSPRFLVTQVVLGMRSRISCGVGLKSNQTLIGCSHKLCATIALVYFAGRTDCRSKVLWLVGVYVSLLVACKVPSCTEDTGTQG